MAPTQLHAGAGRRQERGAGHTSGCWQVARTDRLAVSQMMSLPSTPAVALSGSMCAILAASTESV